MVAFNPEQPDTKDPSYLGLFKPVSDFSLRSGEGIALKDAGTMLEGAVKGADEITKAFVREDVRTRAKPLADEYEKNLELTRQALMGPQRTAGLKPTSVVDASADKNYPGHANPEFED